MRIPNLKPAKLVAKAYKALTRKKPVNDRVQSRLAKVLSTFDLTTLGVGSTLGIGIYVLAGEVAKSIAGPAVVLSFLIAAIASMFAALSYAEIGARVPKAGSAYIYSYVTIGEFMAFFIGWNMILEYAIGSASVAKALSEYLDSILGYVMRDFFMKYAPINVPGLSAYPDAFAFLVTILVSVALALGAKESSFFNNIFTVTNITIVAFLILTGLFKVDSSNWQIPLRSVPEGYGTGGFMPYGFSGVLRGASVCFYAFIGFDSIATAGEEAKYPRRSIPLAFCISLSLIFLAYVCMSMVLTMMLPYFQQDSNAPLVYAFQVKGWVIGKYAVLVGAMFGLCASLIGTMFPLPRVIFSMASDGLLFKFMGKIHPKFKTPCNGTLVTGLITALVATFFNLSELIHMMSIGTLLAYTMVSCCVLILRYNEDDPYYHHYHPGTTERMNKNWFKKLCNYDGDKVASKNSSNIATWGCAIYCILCVILGIMLSLFEDDLSDPYSACIKIVIVSVVAMISVVLVIKRQPRSRIDLAFRTPLVPWIPALSIFINIYLAIKLDVTTWLRFTVWIVIGFLIYFGYSVWNSNERKRLNERSIVVQTTRTIPIIHISETIL